LSDKMRVHILARELNVSSKLILEKCKAEGLDNVVKNHMSTLSAGLYETIREWFSEGVNATAIETAAPVDLTKVRARARRKQEARPSALGEDGAPGDAETAVAVEYLPSEELAEGEPIDVSADEATPAPSLVGEAPQPIQVAEPAPESQPHMPTAPSPPGIAPSFPPHKGKLPERVPVHAAQRPVEPAREAHPELETAGVSAGVAAPVGDRGTEVATGGTVSEEPPTAMQPAGPQNVPSPVKLKGPRVVRYEAPERDIYPPRPARPVRREGEAVLPPRRPDLPPADGGGDRGARRGGTRPPPARRHGRTASSGGVQEWKSRDLEERNERLAGVTGRRIHRRRATQGEPGRAPSAPEQKSQARIHEPVRMREFCEQTGLNFLKCFKILKDQQSILANINTILPTDVAQLLALEFGIELQVIPARTQLDIMQEEVESRERTNLRPRPPVVTMLGHVDHGKTSLLDAIRAARVAASEDGGITQHIGAYYLHTPRGAVTFLDTPGHRAFSAMRARGANLTDVVVLVVAADDGVMPQTVEAINHAKSAGVTIVVALNKIDLGEQNLIKIYGQLSEHGLTPSGDWGGEIDVIPTSATTGRGVRELIDHLADLSELLDLQADPTVPAAATVIEAETRTGVGPVARILVREGTLRVGDIVVCGNAYGKVRALMNDRGQKLEEAGPSVPVEVWGLDDVAVAGDGLFVVDNLQQAKGVSAEVKQTRLESSRLQSRKVTSLEEMLQRRETGDIPELNVIVKGDVDGSVQMLQQTLAEFPSREVRLTVRHAGVGAVTDSDVLLAAACRGIVAAFRVEAPAVVRRLADQHGVEIRAYKVVYDLTDDIRKAMEGLLEPERRIEPRATAEVRNVFRISKVGVVAGCYVTDGTFERSHVARVLRDGVIVRDGAAIASLKRFRDDVKEVRNGLECGIRLQDFDDVHVGDVIESYEIIRVARKLQLADAASS
jgi:translation initiation factor IF-2